MTTSCGSDRGQPITGIEHSVQGYVGSERCEACHGPYLPAPVHGTYHQDWLNSIHGQTAATAPTESTIVGDHDSNGKSDFKDGLDLGSLPEWSDYTVAGGASGEFAPLLDFKAKKNTYTVKLGSRIFNVIKVAGTGRHQQAYLTTMDNSTYVLPLVYRVASGTWHPFMPENWFTWHDTNSNGLIDGGETITGLMYPGAAYSPVTMGRTGDAWERNCAGCHVTGITSLQKSIFGEFIAQYSEDGVGCEACHGPGLLHAKNTGGKGFPDRAIVNPSKLSASKHRDICMSCHSRGVSVGSVGGDSMEFPWRIDNMPFIPGQTLSAAFTITPKVNEPVHELQGGQTHMGLAGSKFGSWSQDCQDCHSAHNTTNLALVRMKVTTPASGEKDVVFTSRSGPPGSGGLMGDASDGTFTDICEVCHTQTAYFRNDPSTPSTNHNNGAACTDCHLHSRGFPTPDSTGGIVCAQCHDYLFTSMNVPTAEYRHLLFDAGTTYPTNPGTWRCLTCHVDHDIFLPGSSPTSGRGANLRTDIAVVPTLNTGFTNTDFQNSGNGGLCISCHTNNRPKSYVRPDGSSITPAIPYDAPVAQQVASYQGAMHGGGYKVTSIFNNGGTNTFLANCSKCHNDDLNPKSGVAGQTGTVKFGLHKSTMSRILSPLGFGGAANPMEEKFCYRCHSRITEPVGGTKKPAANRDWYDIRPMSNRAEDIWSVNGKNFGHKVESYSGLHATIEGTTWNWNPSASRHVECEDCHNPHANGPSRLFDTSGTFAQPVTPTNQAANTPISFVWGVDVAWPAAWTTPNPATAYSRVEASTYAWQVCLKCHSGYGYGATPPAGETDQALEFNPNNASYHAVIGASKTTFPPNSSFVGPWKKTSQMSCADCHTSNNKNDAQGPHGSAFTGILPGRFNNTTGQSGTSDHLCFKCHSFNVYGRDGNAGWTATGFSDGDENLHTLHAKKDHFNAGRKSTCFDCHAAVPHGWFRRALLIVTGDPGPYNNGAAALSPLDVPGWPSSGNWQESSCNNSPCH